MSKRLLVSTVSVLLTCLGCASVPRMDVRAERYRIDVRLDPAEHRIRGRTSIDLTRTGDQELSPNQTVGIELLLHPGLKITSVRASGAEVRPALGRRLLETPSLDASTSDASDRPAADDSDGSTTPARHVVFLDRPSEAMTLFVDYEGTVFQDVAAGERPGEIHNLQMQAHVGTDGVYLAGGHWYPRPVRAGIAAELADYSLIADPLPGMALVASGERDSTFSEATGRAAWRSPYPLPEMVLVGGNHQVHEQDINGVLVSLHLKPDQAKHAEGLFDAVAFYFDRYEPLIGDYPASDFRIVDNFFSSGFAFPTFTLLSSAVINMGERAQQTHGYLDHELLHNWWGNGVFVDPRDGNWCEALASYGANYYGFVLDGDEDEARRKRRNFAHFLSRIEPEKDRPLGTYGLKDGCGRSIAYDKGAAVFHMLARTIGQETFWSAMRRLTAERVGRFASWEDLRRVCEAESGEDLSTFFDQWVRRGGAPMLTLESARFDSADQQLELVILQGEPPFQLDVPIRITLGDRTEDTRLRVTEASATVSVPVTGVPTAVELDPDYHVFRRVPPARILPTTASTRSGGAFTAVQPAGEVWERYRKIHSVFSSSFDPGERIAATVGQLTGEHLAERCVLILGDAVRDNYVSAFLSAVEFPVHWIENGFEFEGEAYTDPAVALLCTVPHPGVHGGGITVVYANSEDAVPAPFAVPMYDRSLVIFNAGRAVLKRDFEQRATVEVTPQ